MKHVVAHPVELRERNQHHGQEVPDGIWEFKKKKNLLKILKESTFLAAADGCLILSVYGCCFINIAVSGGFVFRVM